MAAVSFDEKVLAAKSIICDIEGTTSSVDFVKDVLFPYALKNVEEYLKTHWNDDATKTVVAALREQAEEDKKAEVEGVVTIPAEDSEDVIPDIVKNVEWQMSLDRKTGSLKTLQGLVWAKGYKDGSIKGHVYEDVSKAFEQWTQAGRKIYIYSSGSVDAQKLLFEHSEQGDLVKYLAGHYDTKIGAKQEKDSYAAILKNIEVSAEEALFLTDIIAEAKAAKEAGLNVVLLDRPGNAELSEDDRKEFTVISSFTDIPIEAVEEESTNGAGKRKIDETAQDDEAQPPSKVVKVNGNTADEAENELPKNPAVVVENGANHTKDEQPVAEKMDVDVEMTDASAKETKPTETDVTEKTDTSAVETEISAGEKNELNRKPDSEQKKQVAKQEEIAISETKQEKEVENKPEEDKVEDKKCTETAPPPKKSKEDSEKMEIDEAKTDKDATNSKDIKEAVDSTINSTETSKQEETVAQTESTTPKAETTKEAEPKIAEKSTEIASGKPADPVEAISAKKEETAKEDITMKEAKTDATASETDVSATPEAKKEGTVAVDNLTEIKTDSTEEKKTTDTVVANVTNTVSETAPEKLEVKPAETEMVKSTEKPKEKEAVPEKEKATETVKETTTEMPVEEAHPIEEKQKEREQKADISSTVEAVPEDKRVEVTTTGPVEEVAVEAKEESMETDASPSVAAADSKPEVEKKTVTPTTTEKMETDSVKTEESKPAATEEKKNVDLEATVSTTVTEKTTENGTHQNGTSAEPTSGKEEQRVPENGEAEPKISTNGGTNGTHDEEKSDSDKENDTSSTNVEEVTDAATTNGNENDSSSTTTATSTSTASSTTDLVTEIKSKKVIDVGASAPTPPIEAES
ncbi:enolase-phosphatase E1 isoform X2 [Wyeomyia smithii]|uniref:enolase-phosphatase E1 isoform X2 n=1 Tax=Wyeomyia smithii TaxID=174621 RepID=UPI002467BA5A|nr:enolase-phosphatase E1 isoform X2 [Wyeomyia smithii]